MLVISPVQLIFIALFFPPFRESDGFRIGLGSAPNKQSNSNSDGKGGSFYIVIKRYEPNQKGKGQGISLSKDPSSQAFSNDCSLSRSSIKVNGVEYSASRPGHNFIIINPKNGKVIGRTTFDTNVNFWSGLALSNYVSKIPDGSIVVVSTQVNLLSLTSILTIKIRNSVFCLRSHIPGNGPYSSFCLKTRFLW